MVISDWISAPVARVAMNESTLSTTTTSPLTTPTSSAADIAKAGGLAGAVECDQRMDLAGCDVQVDVLQRLGSAESLRQTGHPQHRPVALLRPRQPHALPRAARLSPRRAAGMLPAARGFGQFRPQSASNCAW
ncbi:hypothetical protein SALBM311S_11894 [Streptomyces alboniger]